MNENKAPNKNNEDTKMERRGLKRAVWIVLGFVAALFIFQAGEMVGYHKASFSLRWGQNYEKNFGGPRFGFVPVPGRQNDDFMSAHGTAGIVLKIDGAIIVLQSNNNTEKVVVTATSTSFRKEGEAATLKDVKPNDKVVVIGAPNDAGQIEAKFVRIFAPQQ